MNQIRIGLVDDHGLFRNGILRILEGNAGLLVKIESESGLDLLDQMAIHKIDMVITDVEMPGMSGIEVTQIVKRDYPEVKVIGVSVHDGIATVKQMIGAGASGYVLKSADPPELFTAIRQVMDGKLYFSQALTKKLVQAVNKQNVLVNDQDLNGRDLDLMHLIFEEHTDQEISEKLKLSLKTVQRIKKELIERLNVRSVVGLVKHMILNKLV